MSLFVVGESVDGDDGDDGGGLLEGAPFREWQQDDESSISMDNDDDFEAMLDNVNVEAIYVGCFYDYDCFCWLSYI
eukprot:m.32829 g.32829  ORF g.32829 m.32829 type:complete len:76 (+) comp6413_c0_seq4:31-258(+)